VLGVLAAASLLVPASVGAQAKSSPQPRIVGGGSVSIAKYPWQAAVVYTGDGTAHNRQFCGGSLITSRIVLTAGHCVADTDPDCGPFAAFGRPFICNALFDPGGDGTAKIDPNDVDAVLGRTTLTDTSQGAEVSLAGTAVQSNYDGDFGSGVPRFDVAYLVLSAASSQPQIHIADSSQGALWDPGSPVDISGWGTTSDSSGDTQNTLRAATVNVLADSSCGSAYGSDYDSSTMVCAGFQSGGVDTCSGDSGGPLQASLGDGAYALVGITGWGDGCARANAPGVYTRVAGSTVRSLVESDVASLEAGFDLPPERPVGTTRAGTKATSKASNPLAKCKRAHSKKKRKRCIKKAKRKQTPA